MTKCKYLLQYCSATALCCLVFTSAYSWQSDSPECPYQEPYSAEANSGCLIVSDKGIMVVERRIDRSLDFPGGTSEQGESARCTAFRETFEETGHTVQVKEFLVEFDSGYHVYHCSTTTPEKPFVVHDKIEINRVYWQKVDQLPIDQWRFPNSLRR